MGDGVIGQDGEQAPAWHIMARDSGLVEREWCSVYDDFRVTLIDRDVGDFTIKVPYRVRDEATGTLRLSPPAGVLVPPDGSPYGGIVVRPLGSDNKAFSGSITDAWITEGGEYGDEAVLTAVGLEDTQVLAANVAFPDPAVDIPTGSLHTFSVEADVETGTSEALSVHYVNVNIGPGAVARRKVAGLVVPAVLGIGNQTSRTFRARFTNLLELLRELAALGGFTFRVVQSGDGQITLEIRARQDRVEAVFARSNGSLSSATLVRRKARVDDVIALGSGEGAARVMTRVSSASGQVPRTTRVIDQRHTGEFAELQDAANAELTEGAAQAGVQVTATDLPHMRFGVHYSLGDTVYASIGGQDIADTVRQVVLEHRAGQPPTVTPSIGATEETTEQVGAVQRLQAAVAQLQRRR
jgi:hypothetical protein